MDLKALCSRIDHTLLKPTASIDEIRFLCEEALEFGMASVCIPPCYVSWVRDNFGEGINICTVVGFPLGYQSTEVKILEAQRAVGDGAGELDMVINNCDVKNKNFEGVENEIAAVKKAIGNRVLKVIVETCYLDRKEKIRLCEILSRVKADYIKTSTGFGPKGAVMEDIALFREHLGPSVKIKAAGGIRSLDDMEAFIRAGCDRIGSSWAARLIKKA